VHRNVPASWRERGSLLMAPLHICNDININYAQTIWGGAVEQTGDAESTTWNHKS